MKNGDSPFTPVNARDKLLETAEAALYEPKPDPVLAVLIAICGKLDDISRKLDQPRYGEIPGRILSTKELCEKMRWTRRTLSKYATQGLPRVATGRYDLNEVLSWLGAREEGRKAQKENGLGRQRKSYRHIEAERW